MPGWAVTEAHRAEPGALFGRHDELALLLSLVEEAGRPVSIVGRSGTGKSTLAHAAAAALRTASSWASASVTMRPGRQAPEDLLVGAARALDLVPGRTRSLAHQIHGALASSPTLLVIDDVDESAGLGATIDELLARNPTLRVVTTGHDTVPIGRIRTIRLRGLSTPAADDLVAARASPAVALFCARAEAVDARFSLNASNVAIVVEICRRLDGLPLALELAAARLTALEPPQLLHQLIEHAPHEVLGARAGERAAGRRSLHDAIEWSVVSLSRADQLLLLRRLAVFEHDFTLTTARAVVGSTRLDDTHALLDGIVTLVDANLVDPIPARRSDDQADPRYRLPSTIRAFALTSLGATGPGPAVDEAHTQCFSSLADAAALGLCSADHLRWSAALVRDRTEYEASWRKLVEAGDLDAALRMTAALVPLWLTDGCTETDRSALEQLVSSSQSGNADPNAMASGLMWSARLSMERQPFEGLADPVLRRMDEALQLSRTTGDRRLLLCNLDLLALALGVLLDACRSDPVIAEGRAVAGSSGDAWWQAKFACWAAKSAQQQGHVDLAGDIGRDVLARARRLGDDHLIVQAGLLLNSLPGGSAGASAPRLDELLVVARRSRDAQAESWVYATSATQAALGHDIDGAVGHLLAGLRASRRSGSWSSIATSLIGVAFIAHRTGEDALAARVLGSVTSTLPTLRRVMAPSHVSDLETLLRRLQTRLGDDRFDAASLDGAQLTLYEMAAVALLWLDQVHAAVPRDTAHASTDVDVTPPGEELTSREVEVLRLMVTGDTNKDIGRALGISPKTVMHHSVSIYRKLMVRGRAEATAHALRKGLV